MNSSETPTRSGRSHHGLCSFMPAQRRSQDMGWRLSFETATAHFHSRPDAEFTRVPPAVQGNSR